MRGNHKTGERRIGTPSQQRTDGAKHGRRQAQHGDAGQRPQPACQEKNNPGNQTDMQTGNGDQMQRAGLAQDLPLLVAHAAAIAVGQRHDDAGIGIVRQLRADAIAQVLPQPVDVMPRRAFSYPLRDDVLAHIPLGADSVAKQMRFIIESAGILIAVRTVETHAQAPGFARARTKGKIVAVEQDMSREMHRFTVTFGARYFQLEALSELRFLRNVGNASFDNEVFALEFAREAVL